MRLFLWILCLLLTTAATSASEFDMIRNADGKIVYLELAEDSQLRIFLEIQEKYQQDLALKTLVLANQEKIPDKQLEALQAFLKDYGQSLETLVVVRRGKASAKLNARHMLAILTSLEGSSLKTFRWENQDKISNSSEIHEFARTSPIWQQLEELSFKETPIDQAAFFLYNCQFSSLKRLDLSYSDLGKRLITLLFRKPEHLPVLERLHLNGNAHIESLQKAFVKISDADMLKTLKRLSVYDEEYQQDKYLSFAKNTGEMLPNLEALFCYVKPEGDQNERFRNDGTFYIEDSEFVTGNNLGQLTQLFTYYPSLISTGRFFSLNSVSNGASIADASSRNQYFVSDPSKLDSIIESDIARQISELTLLGPTFSSDKLQKLFDQKEKLPELQHLFLIGVSIELDHYESLTEKFQEHSIGLHWIGRKSIENSITPSGWNNWNYDPNPFNFPQVQPPKFP